MLSAAMGAFFSSEQSTVTPALPSPSKTHNNSNSSGSPSHFSSPNSTMSTSDSNSPKSEPNSPDFGTRPSEQSKVEDIGPDQSAKSDSGTEEQVRNEIKEAEEDEGEEEQGECGFCLFMKAGGCRDSFIAWENCVEEAEKNEEDIVEKCVEVTGALKKCMEAHADYYEPILRAEKVAEEEAIIELEKEAAAENADLKDMEDNIKT